MCGVCACVCVCVCVRARARMRVCCGGWGCLVKIARKKGKENLIRSLYLDILESYRQENERIPSCSHLYLNNSAPQTLLKSEV